MQITMVCFRVISVFMLYFGIPKMLSGESSMSTESLENTLNEDMSVFFSTGRISRNIRRISHELNLGKGIQFNKRIDIWPQNRSSLLCLTCSIAVNQMLKITDPETFTERMITLCVTFKIGIYPVCKGLIDENIDQMVYILKNTPNKSGSDICGVVLFGIGCHSKNKNRFFEVDLPPYPKPKIEEPPYLEQPVSTMKILHLADTHYDFKYLPGSPADCDEVILCCQTTSSDKQNRSRIAGKWGTYGRCDIPKWTLEAIYQHISETHKDIDIILWTGDVAPHNVWNTSRKEILHSLRDMATLISEYFPGIPVFPAIGNHEASPVNLFPQPYIKKSEFKISWLYEELSEIWKQWLPEDVAAVIPKGGFYSTTIRPGLRIISLNTNFCYSLNWWLILDSTDIHNELNLLAKEIQLAENAGDKVYIIGHISPGFKSCLPSWSHQFNKIINRYESTVTGLFFGHTHNDHFELFFDANNSRRVYDVGYIAQSQTTYENANPGYKIYTVEGNFNGSFYRVIDHSNWLMDLGISNKYDKPHFYESYSAIKDYKLPNLNPESLYELVLKMNEDSELFDAFYRNYVKSSPRDLEKGCNKKCKFNILCALLTSDSSKKSLCKKHLR